MALFARGSEEDKRQRNKEKRELQKPFVLDVVWEHSQVCSLTLHRTLAVRTHVVGDDSLSDVVLEKKDQASTRSQGRNRILLSTQSTGQRTG